MIELLNIDCMEYMKTVPDKYFDLAIVDPPYGIGKKLLVGGKTGRVKFHELYALNQWDNEAPPKEYFDELFRVSSNQIIWGGNYFLDHLKSTRGIICWDKNKGDVYNFSHWEMAWTSFDCIARIFKKHSHVTDTDKIHPTQKPVKLYKWLLENYATCKHCDNQGGDYEDVVGDGGSRMWIECEHCDVAEKGRPKILDTHLGSGSIAIACHDLGFDLVGCELDKDYYDAAVKRFNNHKLQTKLF